jgi:hypothetical protein
MADEKMTHSEITKPRRRIEVRDLAIAAYYPQTQSTAPLPATITPPALSLQKRQRDNPNPLQNVAKPWKKPWDK